MEERHRRLAWLAFDGLDRQLYTLVATPFVAELLGGLDQRDGAVGRTGSIVQAGFLVGWALGGGFFGRFGDRIGRTRALNVTILTYALFTGLSFFAQTWWQLLVCRFLAASGIGGEWAVGAALISETWPRRWRPRMAAVLQSAVNVRVVLAMVAGFLPSGFPPRTVFLVGVLPAFLVVWIRRAVPEPEEWHAARSAAAESSPGVDDRFRGDVRRTTILTTVVCSLSLTAHWAFLYWYLQHRRNHPDVGPWTDGEKTAFCSQAMILVMVASIFGNFRAAFFARSRGYRRSIAFLFVAFLFIAYFAAMLARRDRRPSAIACDATGCCHRPGPDGFTESPW